MVYYASLAVYRLYFSPLAKFPGPKLAALTLWFEFYYDVVKRGRYTWKIAEMHKQYGELSLRRERQLQISDVDQGHRTNCAHQSTRTPHRRP